MPLNRTELQDIIKSGREDPEIDIQIRAAALLELLQVTQFKDLKQRAMQAGLQNELQEDLRRAISTFPPSPSMKLAAPPDVTARLRDCVRARLRRKNPIWMIHGGDSDFWITVRRLLTESGHITREFNDRNLADIPLITDRVSTMCKGCRIAVAVMTARTGDDSRYPRPNICHEIGMAHATLGFSRVILLREEGIEKVSNFDGLLYITFSQRSIDTALQKLLHQVDAILEIDEANS